MMETSDGRTDMDGRTHTLRDHDQLATFAPEILWGISQEETEMKCSESTRRPWKLWKLWKVFVTNCILDLMSIPHFQLQLV